MHDQWIGIQSAGGRHPVAEAERTTFFLVLIVVLTNIKFVNELCNYIGLK